MPKTDPKDPRFRPYRVAAYLTYLVVVTIFSLLIIVSVVRSVFAMTPPHLPASPLTLTVRECLDRADLLFGELEARRRELGDTSSAREADARWLEFRLDWSKRHREAESVCALESQQRPALKAVFGHLERAMDLYTTHSVQYQGEVGPTVEAFRKAREQARKDAL
jgi:hypothetical protein